MRVIVGVVYGGPEYLGQDVFLTLSLPYLIYLLQVYIRFFFLEKSFTINRN